ncbi:MAG: hypothetical protein AUK35_02035 [Zetaproteobacteria bacterium CG2_30_46_52]|nr:MAG: hypothetical protein AUK35_02035 [Zetaproteobacteria bacterium CG2_30_46_52]
MKELVWDLFVRFFHWSLVASFTVAYLAAEYGYDDVHEWLGYFLLLLVVARIVWGFIGTKYARFSSFVFPISTYIANIKSILTGNHKEHYYGHAPVAGLMVFVLISSLVVMGISGLVLLGWGEYMGPVWALNIPVSDAMGALSKLVHYQLAVILLIFIGLHIGGVVLAVVQHKENIVRAMVTGYKNKH